MRYSALFLLKQNSIDAEMLLHLHNCWSACVFVKTLLHCKCAAAFILEVFFLLGIAIGFSHYIAVGCNL